MAMYPSQEWCDEWKKALNEDTRIVETGKNWGVDFKGSVLFEITPGDGLQETAYIYLEIPAGKCVDARTLVDSSDVDPGFSISGSYTEFKPVVMGKVDFLQSVVKGNIKLHGNMMTVMKNAKFIRAVANSISSFESEYLNE